MFVAFDAGITNIGMVAATVDDQHRIARVVRAESFDLMHVPHERVALCDCALKHDNTIAARFAHFIQEEAPLLEQAEHILVEQQPPGSAGTAFEQLLLFSFPNKTSRVHPRSMHAHFGFGALDYDGRKRAAVRRAQSVLTLFRGACGREHDVADAFCLLQFELSKRAEQLRREHAARRAALSVSDLWRFAYTGPRYHPASTDGSGRNAVSVSLAAASDSDDRLGAESSASSESASDVSRSGAAAGGASSDVPSSCSSSGAAAGDAFSMARSLLCRSSSSCSMPTKRE
jgi:hypothetical protein